MCELNSDSSDLTIEIKRSIDDAIDLTEDLGFLNSRKVKHDIP